MTDPKADREDLDNAIAMLADGLRGATDLLRASGFTSVLRPPKPSPSASELPKGAALQAHVAEPSYEEPTQSHDSPLGRQLESRRRTGGEGSVEVRPTGAVPNLVASPLPVLPAESDETETTAAIAHLLSSEMAPAAKLMHLEQAIIGDCQRCKLHRSRARLVFGVGNPEAELVFVGEGPGAEEDRQGEPFVGKAGMLLTKMIQAMGYERGDVYICNVAKCRPPGNRDPEPDEVQACETFLRAQLGVLRPRVIVTLGKYAAQTLLRTELPISRLRGKWARYEGIALLPTFHPAYLLRSPEKKREAWADLQEVMRALGQPVADAEAKGPREP